jgi:predicted ATPase/DNA-binding winged helix-turn-helix (wHTH) protein
MAADPLAYVFDHIEIRTGLRQVLVDGVPAPLGPRAFDVLMALVERHDRTVSKEELLDAVWPEAPVQEHNLAVQVGNLRRLLGPHVVSTVPGRGYRFTATLTRRPLVMVESPSPPLAPAAAGAGPDRYMLPTVGRDADLELLHGLLPAHRLVTLVGAGGVGKTHIARHVLLERRALYPHGVGWVELAPLTDGLQAPGAIARALGLEMGSDDPLAGLVAALRPSELLLVLDNAEHLVDEIARIVDALLAAAPGVRIVATSQVPLGLSCERVMRLEPLALPPAGAGAAEAAGYGAVAFFVQRAQAADRHFALDDGNVAEVIGICRQLDGIALAEEMAAARVPLLGVKGLAAALHDQLRLLSSSRRDAPKRQQTLRATLEWSYRLLGRIEQAVLRRLSVFVGSFPLELALEVAPEGEAEHDRWDVLDALGGLVDRSMLMVDDNDPPRYRLLESTRAYARSRLRDAGEVDATQARHARAVHRHVRRIFDVRFTDFDTARRRLALDVDDTRAALEWALQHDPHIAVSLVHPLTVASAEDARDDGMWDATERLLSDAMPVRLRADWASGAASLRRKDMRFRTHWTRRAAELWRQVGDAQELMMALLRTVNDRRAQDDDEHRAARDELRRLNTPSQPTYLRLRALMSEASVLSVRGEPLRAEQLFRDGLQLAAHSADTAGATLLMLGLIDAELSAAHYEQAIEHARGLAQQLRPTRHYGLLVMVLLNMVAAQLLQGSAHHVRQARVSAVETWPLACAFELQVVLGDYLALLAALEDRPQAAARLLGWVDNGYEQLGLEREPTEGRAMAQTRQLARDRLGPAAFDHERALGRALGEKEVEVLAFGAAAG